MTLFAIESGPLPLLGALFGLENGGGWTTLGVVRHGTAAPLSELADELQAGSEAYIECIMTLTNIAAVFQALGTPFAPSLTEGQPHHKCSRMVRFQPWLGAFHAFDAFLFEPAGKKMKTNKVVHTEW